ncbi:adenylyl-sulfate kinase [Salinimicrobium sp. GXAS 041]|uniref:adenylyl-sulfate kinase n=1 Tax=Salinimicrobium sp. GXAS 041 TaxID=3400806 RepID=UPI003C71DC3C
MNNIIPQDFHIDCSLRSELKGHKPLLLWFIGLSGSGKSTLANLIEKSLFERNIHTYTLDGDNIRCGLSSNLGFSENERTENLRRTAEVAKLFLDAGTVVLASFITPKKSDRSLIKNIVGKESYVEIYINTSFKECEKRDIKGLYKKAREGKIENFTGVDSPFEAPENADIEIKTEQQTIEESAKQILKNILPKLKAEVHE